MRLEWLDSIRHRRDRAKTEGAHEDRTERFETEVLAVGESLYGHALRLTRDMNDAEDLVQDTPARAYVNFDKYRAATNFKAWMLRIMTNIYINRHRQQSREPVKESLDADEGFSLYERIASASPDSKNPEDVVLDRLGESAIRESVSLLPQEYRIVVALVDVEDLSYEQTSEALGVPVGTVKSKLHRGRAMLQKKLYSYAKEMGYI